MREQWRRNFVEEWNRIETAISRGESVEPHDGGEADKTKKRTKK